ncbi:hypothetical protein EYF80_004495 [Liparis tanakae]|uniref:Uncharacterized protein n=1 Tax=Liparis tanakae TaxID=230148 RepID=A0A4Z2J474_9TELE|nr:hypothetical protein EYF80_004495 [Liparis tanakae]
MRNIRHLVHPKLVKVFRVTVCLSRNNSLREEVPAEERMEGSESSQPDLHIGGIRFDLSLPRAGSHVSQETLPVCARGPLPVSTALEITQESSDSRFTSGGAEEQDMHMENKYAN